MKCPYPKAFIELVDNKTILDLTTKQLTQYIDQYDTDLSLVLMTSFHTKDQINSAIKFYEDRLRNIYTFEQSAMPRINAETHEPLASNSAKSGKKLQKEDWYPPGHGDFFSSFATSGLLDKFLEEGKEWAFVSNVDNLGAYPDPRMVEKVEYFAKEYGADWIGEVTAKTLSDTKGGAYIRIGDSIRLIESAQIPEEFVADFKGSKAFKYFNTNNNWINLRSLKRKIEANKIKTDVIANIKNVDNLRIIQFESGISSGITSFDKPVCIEVNRDRFIPIKTCEDLLPLIGNLIKINSSGFCTSKTHNLPLVKLGRHFKSLKDFNERIPRKIDISELLHLTVSGDVTFGSNVKLKGNVIIIAQEGSSINIPSGSVLENKVITGNLHIHDH